MSATVMSISKYPVPGLVAALLNLSQMSASISVTPQVTLTHLSTSCSTTDSSIKCESKYRVESSATIDSIEYKIMYGTADVITAYFSGCNMSVTSGSTITITLTESYSI